MICWHDMFARHVLSENVFESRNVVPPGFDFSSFVSQEQHLTGQGRTAGDLLRWLAVGGLALRKLFEESGPKIASFCSSISLFSAFSSFVSWTCFWHTIGFQLISLKLLPLKWCLSNISLRTTRIVKPNHTDTKVPSRYCNDVPSGGFDRTIQPFNICWS